MLARVTNTDRKRARLTLQWSAIALGLLCLCAVVFTVYALVIKPHFLAKTSTSENKAHQSSWYGSASHLLKKPSAIAFGENGETYVADAGAGEIVVFDRYGQRSRAFGARSLKTPVSLATARDGRIYVIDAASSALFIFDSDEALTKKLTFKEARPQSATVAAPVAQAGQSDQSDEEALYVTFPTGVITGTLDGSFTRGYFAGGTSSDQFAGADAFALTSSGRAIICDVLNRKVSALDSLDTSPTLMWLTDSGDVGLPSGIALEGDIAYIADAQKNSILSFDVRTGRAKGSLATAGSEDGSVSQPQGLAIKDGLLYVADSGNARVQIFSLGQRAVDVVGPSALERYGLIGLCIVLAVGSIVCWILRLRVKPGRYLVDYSVAERLGERAIRHPLELITEQIYAIDELGEWVYKGLENSPLERKAAAPSARAFSAVKNAYPELDAFDKATLATAQAESMTLVTVDERVRQIATELGIEVVSPSEIAQEERAAHPPVEIPPHQGLIDDALIKDLADDDRFADDERSEQQTADQGASEDGATTLRPLLAITLVAFIAAVLFFAASLIARADSVEVQEISLASLTRPAGQAASDARITLSDDAPAHNEWKGLCSACHSETLERDDLITTQPTTCEFCHSASAKGGGFMAYRSSGGDSSALGEQNSGHESGLHDGIPASSAQGLIALNCFSCHSAHAQKTTSCETCHDKTRASSDAISAYKEEQKQPARGSDHFTLSTSVQAHSSDTRVNNGLAAHSAAKLICADCHRGDLSAQGECEPCHYTANSFEKDEKRLSRESDWPHMSTNDTALLGSWTTRSSGSRAGTVTHEQGGVTLENQTRLVCGRCHTTTDGKVFSLSVHALRHDAVRSGEVEYLTSTVTSSTITSLSTGYVGTGGNENSAPFADSYEFGPEDGSIEGVACSECHYSEVQIEHNLRSEKGCASCHTVTKEDGTTDWNQVEPGMTARSFSTCGTNNDACHKDSWHGARPEDMRASHQLTTASGQTLKTSSCSQSADGQSCHGASSAQSLFKFGALDLASAHNDYWIAQKQTYATNANYTSTISDIESVRGCGLCHSKESATVYGAQQRDDAKSSNKSFDCSSCHSITTAVYAQNDCFKAQRFTLPSTVQEQEQKKESELSKEANSYLETLAEQQGKQQASSTDSSSNQGTSPLSSASTSQGVATIPQSSLPLTSPLPTTSPFSLISTYLTPYPSLLNRPVTSWQNL